MSRNTGTDALLQDAVNFATAAVAAEEEKKYSVARSFYIQAADNLMDLIARARENNDVSVNIEQLKRKAESYLNRAVELHNAQQAAAASVRQHKSALEIEYDRAKFLVSSAIEADESGNQEDAFSAYADAVDLLLGFRKRAESELARPENAQQREVLTKMMSEANTLASSALQRAEQLKQVDGASVSRTGPVAPSLAGSGFKSRPLGDALRDDAARSDSSRATTVARGGAKFSDEEKAVLLETSTINGRVYPPFIDEADSRERFMYPLPFTDREGPLALSAKQLSRFDRWARPSEFIDEPKMIELISYHSIKQTVITDCSFVASLTVCAQYERRFGKRLLTNCIFPQRSSDGAPIYNPCGKYVVRMQLNGCKRKIVIDDTLPLSRDGRLLCSYSVNANELWVSLLEKAYLKVMGGYDFPGSNGNIDLHALTGWIPERLATADLSGKPEGGGKAGESESERVFRMLHGKFHAGQCLVTAATGPMNEADADRAGLVPTHAYAVLDLRKVRVGDSELRFIQLKNPWSTVSWKGRYSASDTSSWTPALRRALDYEPEKARLHDDGIFWIDLEAFQRFFDVLYVNWSPALFSFKSTVHHRWPAACGPKRDLFNISDNPQYSLAFGSLSTAATCWILLTRHITDKEDFADNRKFIALVVYRSDCDAKARRVYYPNDPKPIIDGIRINSPHYLVKLPLSANVSPQNFTLVVTQYEKTDTILYTLRAYSTAPFDLVKISDPYSFKLSEVGEWSTAKRTAGGCANNRDSYHLNPTFQVQLSNNEADNRMLVELRGPRAYNVGFDLVQVASNRGSDTLLRKTSGSFRSGYCYLELEKLDGGVYNIVPSTYLPSQDGHFILSVEATRPVKLVRL